MPRVIRFPLLSLVFLGVAYLTLWGTLALWFKFPGPDPLVAIVSACLAGLGLGTLVAFFSSLRWRWLTIFAIVLIAILIWWQTLVPPAQGNWSPEVARQVTGKIDGDTLTLDNVRAFHWQSKDRFEEKWVSRTYDLSQIESVDLFMSYWGGPAMAHLMLSFGFANGGYLTWSNEVRRESGDAFSPVGDFFKMHPIIVIASEEWDVVGIRSNIREEVVHLFRLRMTPENRRRLIEAYVTAANALSAKPEWFNSVFTNCARTAVLLARHVGIEVPIDYRILVDGYFPDYLYELGVINTAVSLEDLYHLGNITERANATGLSERFSVAIRVNVPEP